MILKKNIRPNLPFFPIRQLTLGRSSKISILNTQNESTIIVGEIELALLRNEPIVQSSTGSTDVKAGQRIQQIEKRNDGIESSDIERPEQSLLCSTLCVGNMQCDN